MSGDDDYRAGIIAAGNDQEASGDDFGDLIDLVMRLDDPSSDADYIAYERALLAKFVIISDVADPLQSPEYQDEL